MNRMTFKSYQKIINLVYLICIAICLFTPRDSQASCSMHDHLCTYHSLGAPVNVQVHGGSAIDNTSNQFVMYAVGTTPTTGTASLVDFDLKGLLPTYTGSRTNELAETYSTPTTPVLISSTTYGRNNPPPDWNKPGDGALQVYPSQYNVYFNQLSAKASHTGDLNGGERIPNPVGCPHMPQGSKNCEAIVVSGNVPNGIYESRARIFNYGNIPNPKVDVALGAYTTGNLMMVTRGHNQVPNGYIEEMSNYSLEGTGAMTPVHQYEVYNRGFKPHAYGVAYYDLNRYTTTYDNVQNYDNYTLQRRYSTKHTTHNRLHGNSGDLDKAYSLSKTELKPLIVAKPPPPLPEKIYCTNGNQSVFCDVPGAVDYNSPEARVLEAKKQEEFLISEAKKQEEINSSCIGETCEDYEKLFGKVPEKYEQFQYPRFPDYCQRAGCIMQEKQETAEYREYMNRPEVISYMEERNKIISNSKGGFYSEIVSPVVHTLLGAAGSVPAVGVIPDSLDWLLTAAEVPSGVSNETDLLLASASIASTVIPVGVDQATAAAKVTVRLTKQTERVLEQKKLIEELSKKYAKKDVVDAAAAGRVVKTDSGKRVGDFTPAQKTFAKEKNAAENGGNMACKDCGRGVENIASKRGVPTPNNQAQVHHDPAIKDGGGRHSEAIVLCPLCHQDRHAMERATP
ncbi:MAG: hypothetical protein RL344_3 [Pseudomonadota bacterium]